MAERQLSEKSRANLRAVREYVPDAVELDKEGPRKGMSLTFQPFVFAGAVPPYSDFVRDVLRYYGISLGHLTPNSIIDLSVFAHLCANWLKVPPSVDLFAAYFFCQPTSQQAKTAIGTCNFQRKRLSGFIPVPRRAYFQKWFDQWLYIQDGGGLEETAVPTTPAVRRPCWTETFDYSPERKRPLLEIHKRVRRLRKRGLTGDLVMLDAIKRRVAPLRNDPNIFPGDAELAAKLAEKRMVRLFGIEATNSAMAAKSVTPEDGDEGDDVEDDDQDTDDDEEVEEEAGDGRDVDQDSDSDEEPKVDVKMFEAVDDDDDRNPEEEDAGAAIQMEMDQPPPYPDTRLFRYRNRKRPCPTAAPASALRPSSPPRDKEEEPGEIKWDRDAKNRLAAQIRYLLRVAAAAARKGDAGTSAAGAMAGGDAGTSAAPQECGDFCCTCDACAPLVFCCKHAGRAQEEPSHEELIPNK